jgi:transcriptional regulator with XRE-family HTH domain
MKTFSGPQLTRRRVKLGLTLSALAEQLGVTRQAVTRWEDGTAAPTCDRLGPLADALCYRLIDDLFEVAEEDRTVGAA